MSEKLRDFCVSLHKMGCIKFGQFTLKSGKESMYYIDLRLLISFPILMDELCSMLTSLLYEREVKFDIICGVPYTALPVSTLISVKTNKPMVLRRKEAKSYGTKQLVEGKFKEGNRCIIVEDVISTGSSILETIADVESVGMIVKDIFAIVDREEGGVQNLINRGYSVHCLYTLSQILKILKSENIITADLNEKILADKATRVPLKISSPVNRGQLRFENRIKLCKSPAAAKLFSLMAEKNTNLCLAADVSDIKKILQLADEVGPHICIFKIHADIIENYSEKERDELKNIAARHDFMIMEDRKLADIGNTVRLQFNQISKWANLITVHSIPGFGVLEAIKNAENYNPNIGVFLVAELSCENNLITDDYTKKTMALADKYSSLVAGIVCQFPTAFSNAGFIQMTPGVNLEENINSDNLGQLYNTPEKVIVERKADIAVVGRGIINSVNPAEVALRYKQKLWSAYISRVQ